MAEESYTVTLTRMLEAPPERVWAMWTENQHLREWFGPKACLIHTSKLDFRPGGSYHYSIRLPDESEMWGKWMFTGIEPQLLLAFTMTFSDEAGNVTLHPWVKDWPRETLTTLKFTPKDSGTELSLNWKAMNASAEEEAVFQAGAGFMQQSWNGTFDQLAEYMKAL